MDETTQTSRSLTGGAGGSTATDAAALVLLWSRDEPARAGELLFVQDGAPASTFGRGSSRGPRALGLVRQRPGGARETGPLTCPRISREQLALAVQPTGAIEVTNLGRCPLVARGREVTRAELLPGDVVELRNELVFLCVRRPLALAPAGLTGREHTFGEPDAFGLVGESPALWDLRAAAGALARRPVHVLVLGPSGSGKELVAHAIHAQSPRAGRPFVARNAATIPESLVDAELFGHARGFPNAGTPERPGLVGEADGGTLFLDEVAELPPASQAHLLRVLDGGEYHRLGEPRARRADLRLVAATNRPEEALKHDVLARFKGRLVVPGLDARREDIPLLAVHLLRRQAASDPTLLARFFPGSDPLAAPRISPDLMTALVLHPYRANVRELDTLLLCASIESRGKYLELTPGAVRLLAPAPAAEPARPAPLPSSAEPPPGEPFTKEEERRLVLLRRHSLSPADAARDPEYGASRQTADLHLRQLMSRALEGSAWDVNAAAALLAGDSAEQRGKARRRLLTFLFNLEKRLEADGASELRKALASEWRAAAPCALRLVDALERGQIRGGGDKGS